MTVEIIDIDLGIDIDSIIANNITELTAAMKEEVDLAIANAKSVQQAKAEQEEAARQLEDDLARVLETAYQALLAAGALGLPVSTVMGLVAGVINTPSALTNRMKSFLTSKGNPYYLHRHKIHGTPHYVFMAYNEAMATAEEPITYQTSPGQQAPKS